MYCQGQTKRNKQTTNMSSDTQQTNQAVNNKPIAKQQTGLVVKNNRNDKQQTNPKWEVHNNKLNGRQQTNDCLG